jgi:hypothetical protein
MAVKPQSVAMTERKILHIRYNSVHRIERGMSALNLTEGNGGIGHLHGLDACDGIWEQCVTVQRTAAAAARTGRIGRSVRPERR